MRKLILLLFCILLILPIVSAEKIYKWSPSNITHVFIDDSTSDYYYSTDFDIPQGSNITNISFMLNVTGDTMDYVLLSVEGTSGLEYADYHINVNNRVMYNDTLTSTNDCVQTCCSGTRAASGFCVIDFRFLFHSESNDVEVTIYDMSVTYNNSQDEEEEEFAISGNFNFTNSTTGIVQTNDCTYGDDLCVYFDSNAIYINTSKYSKDYITVKFNYDADGYNQLFSFYNNNSIDFPIMSYIDSPDVAQEIKVQYQNNPIEGARVYAQILANNSYTGQYEWMYTYSDFTNKNGDVYILLNDQEYYKLCAEHPSYADMCIIFFVPPSNTDTFHFDFQYQLGDADFYDLYSTCGYIAVNDSEPCELIVNTKQYHQNVSFMISYNESGTFKTKSFDFINVTLANFTYNISYDFMPMNITVYIDNIPYRYFYHNRYWPDNINDTNISLNYNSSQGNVYYKRLQESSSYVVVFYILMIVLGIVSGFVIEKYFPKHGVLGAGLFYAFFGTVGFGLFWIMAIPVLFHYVIKGVIPLISNRKIPTSEDKGDSK